MAPMQTSAGERRSDWTDPLGPHVATPRELKALLAAERDGVPFLAYRDQAGTLEIVTLPTEQTALVLGRREGVDLQLAWDGEVSGVHAELRLLGTEWTVVDDGLSRNGTFVNARRVTGRQLLRDGDRIRVGGTVIVFNAAIGSPVAETTTGTSYPQIGELSDTQRRVLIALCRPQLAEGALHAPASNQQIADEVYLSVDTVKTTLRAMFGKYGLDELPQNQKRAGLAEFAVRVGLVTSRDL
jgi:pSer/pThr/pTyr-binding forkhead associated (FHA) protein